MSSLFKEEVSNQWHNLKAFLKMFLIKIVTLFLTLGFVCSNYDDYDQETSCFCYEKPENNVEYRICPNPGK